MYGLYGFLLTSLHKVFCLDKTNNTHHASCFSMSAGRPRTQCVFLETRQIFGTRWFLQLYKHHVSGESDDRMAKCWTLETVVTEDLNAAGFIKDFTTDSQATKLAVFSKSWQSGTPSTNPHQLTTPKVRGIPRVTQVFMAGMIDPKHTTIGGFTISPWVCTKCKR